ncbi:ABC transporter substrate-binding protein [Paenibacillus sp. IB182496]|uniref:ABC transporter substrate-binding protein n=1 Tax=Paenibacillus sabuli TaxID=2772509 RepID=A0A927BT22_9BACL|nr:ABC transporter substrate-binding protein [Paenibacillus sabuli]MBD2845014.1 ABC transporter substrate-binding protein [Paenibacillus sabuli]
MLRRVNLLAAVLLLAALALIGCGNNAEQKAPGQEAAATNGAESGSDEAGQQAVDAPANSAAASGEAAHESGDAWPRTIVDAADHEVTLEERPERIAVLHPLYLDFFFALDTPPIASADAARAMQEYATLQTYDAAGMIDLGSGRDLNLEKIMEAAPDVIVTFKGQVDAIYEELTKIAPVVLINYSDTWEEATRLCAAIIGKEEAAEQYITETEARIADTKTKLGERMKDTFALLRVGDKNAFAAQGSKNTMYYEPQSGFGLQAPEGYPEDSMALSMEALAEMDPDYIIIQHDIERARAAVKEKEELEVWKSLRAVQNDHVLYFDNSLNTGSVLAIRLAAEYLSELAE